MPQFPRVDTPRPRRYSPATSTTGGVFMRQGRTGLGVTLAGALAVASIGLAAAQETTATDENDANGEDVGATARRRADLTPAEQVAEAQRIRERADSLSRRVAAMLDESRREADVIRMNCLNDKLTQINAHRGTLGNRVEALQESVQLGDEGRRNHEFTVVTVLSQNLNELERAANECIGQDLYETGATRVTTTIDPNAPDDDPANVIPVPDVDVPFIPPPASPTT